MKIAAYEPKYRDAIRDICIKTAPVTANETDKCNFILAMCCDCYVDHETVFVLLDDEGIPRGYILCAENFWQYLPNAKTYLKGLKLPYKLLGYGEFLTYLPYVKKYPAHLHIDILEDYTGKGNGKQLMQTLLDHLQEKNIPGVMLHTSASNHRAIAFYNKFGFRLFGTGKILYGMGKQLTPKE